MQLPITVSRKLVPDPAFASVIGRHGPNEVCEDEVLIKVEAILCREKTFRKILQARICQLNMSVIPAV